MDKFLSWVSPDAAVLCARHPSVQEAHEATEVIIGHSGHLEAGGQVTRVVEDKVGQKLGLETHNRSVKNVLSRISTIRNIVVTYLWAGTLDPSSVMKYTSGSSPA